MRAAITPATRAVLLCTPNNPTGPALPHAEVVAFVDRVPERGHGRPGRGVCRVRLPGPTGPRAAAVPDRPNVAVLRTFSKAYGLAGSGSASASAAPVASAVRTASLPFGVSVPAQAAALASLAAEAALLERVAELIRARDSLAGVCGHWGSPCPRPRATSSGCRPGRRPRRTATAFADAGLTVRAFAAGDDQRRRTDHHRRAGGQRAGAASSPPPCPADLVGRPPDSLSTVTVPTWQNRHVGP